jgi:predicted nucleic acid-binding protein
MTYDMLDYEIVSDILAQSSAIIFNPNVLTETSNLLRQIGEPIRSELTQVLAKIIQRVDETIIPSRAAVARTEYARLGLTDAVMLEAARSGGVILTADADLYVAALRANLQAINYNHIREKRKDFRD